jgi:hypothetical protein
MTSVPFLRKTRAISVTNFRSSTICSIDLATPRNRRIRPGTRAAPIHRQERRVGLPVPSVVATCDLRSTIDSNDSSRDSAQIVGAIAGSTGQIQDPQLIQLPDLPSRQTYPERFTMCCVSVGYVSRRSIKSTSFPTDVFRSNRPRAVQSFAAHSRTA